MNFPVTSSILSAQHLGHYLSSRYDFLAGASVKLIRAGINHSYLVKSGNDKYVFRIYSLGWRTELEIQEEIRLLTHLHSEKIPVSFPIADSKDNYLQDLSAPEGERYGLLFSFAEGKKQHNYTEANHFTAGVTVANFHATSRELTLKRTTYTPAILLKDSLPKIAEFLSPHSEEYQYLDSLGSSLVSLLEQSGFSNLPGGVVHLDIWFDNMNLTEKGDLTIFDFDFCGNGPRALDIAYYIMQAHNIARYAPTVYQPNIDKFLAGYESVQPIEQQEKDLFPALGVAIYFFYLGVQCERFENYSNSFLNEDYLKRFINGLVKRYAGIYSL